MKDIFDYNNSKFVYDVEQAQEELQDVDVDKTMEAIEQKLASIEQKIDHIVSIL